MAVVCRNNNSLFDFLLFQFCELMTVVLTHSFKLISFLPLIIS